MTQIKGLLFDKDGTLFDFDATWCAWTDHVIRTEAGGYQDLIERLANRLGYDLQAGRFFPDSLVIAGTAGEVADAISEVIPQDRTALLGRMMVQSAKVPQVEVTPLRPFMAALRARGLKLGVATNDAEAPARANLAKAGVENAFDFVAGFDSGFGGKPEIGQMTAFCDATRLQPSECAMIGDSLHDLHAGRRAGMIPVGVLTGPATRSDLAGVADVVLSSIADLPNWLDRMP